MVLAVEPMPLVETANHRRMRKLGEWFEVDVLDLQAHMRSDAMSDVGFLWCDFIHPTSLGHLEIAQWLAPRLDRELVRILAR